jgi:hypothetical protein
VLDTIFPDIGTTQRRLARFGFYEFSKKLRYELQPSGIIRGYISGGPTSFSRL